MCSPGDLCMRLSQSGYKANCNRQGKNKDQMLNVNMQILLKTAYKNVSTKNKCNNIKMRNNVNGVRDYNIRPWCVQTQFV